LHQFTAKLPEIDPIDAVSTYLEVVNGKKIVGQTTKECMVTGVIGGLLAETETYVKAIAGRYNKVTITICGGDAPTFAPLLSFEAKLADNLVLMGLNQLFLFNQDA
jgi:type III pantothenate kinase